MSDESETLDQYLKGLMSFESVWQAAKKPYGYDSDYQLPPMGVNTEFITATGFSNGSNMST